MEPMNLTQEQWGKLYQKLPQPKDLLFSLLPDLNAVFSAVEHGALLTSQILFYLQEKNKFPLILELVKIAKNQSADVYDFMRCFYGEQQLAEFAMENEIKSWFFRLSTEILEQYELWDILAQREIYEPLIKHKQYDVLERYGLYNILLDCQQYDRLIKAGKAWGLTMTVDGMDFLANVGLWKEFYRGKKVTYLNGYTQKRILDTLWNNGQQGFLMEQQEDEFLLEKGWFKAYQDQGLWGTLAAYGYADQVDWDAYLAKVPALSKNDVFQEAAKLKVWDFLAKHHQHRLLFINKQFGWWLKSF